jgi:hypothetical protein
MRKAALPIPYIVAIILAITVIAVLVYMFLTQTGFFGRGVSQRFCEAEILRFCFDWQKTGAKPNWGSDYGKGCLEIGVLAPSSSDCAKYEITIS